MDDERLKNLGGGNYWRELLERIRDIRSSEKVMYRPLAVSANPNFELIEQKQKKEYIYEPM